MKSSKFQEKVYTVAEVAKLLKVHPKTVLRRIKRGKMPCFVVGRHYRITQTDLNFFIERSRIKSVTQIQREHQERMDALYDKYFGNEMGIS